MTLPVLIWGSIYTWLDQPLNIFLNYEIIEYYLLLLIISL